MAITTKLDPIARDVQVMLDDVRGVDASALLAEFAQQEINDAKEINRSVLGRVPPYKVFVDGQSGAALTSVRPDGVIVAEFELVSDVLKFISSMLHQFSPVKTGTYQRSHILLADGAQVDPLGDVQLAEEYVFINTVPYARKIERGSSTQAPDGVYQATALLARSRFGNVARIAFSFRNLTTGRGRSDRNPAVIVRTR